MALMATMESSCSSNFNSWGNSLELDSTAFTTFNVLPSELGFPIANSEAKSVFLAPSATGRFYNMENLKEESPYKPDPVDAIAGCDHHPSRSVITYRFERPTR